MKIRVLKILTILIILTVNHISCKDESSNKKICNVNNPLTDLPWLKVKVDELTLLSQDNSLHISIYQCKYGDRQIGFFEFHGNANPFYNCDGEVLCVLGGVVGETCPQLNITEKKLIWDIKP